MRLVSCAFYVARHLGQQQVQSKQLADEFAKCRHPTALEVGF